MINKIEILDDSAQVLVQGRSNLEKINQIIDAVNRQEKVLTELIAGATRNGSSAEHAHKILTFLSAKPNEE